MADIMTAAARITYLSIIDLSPCSKPALVAVWFVRSWSSLFAGDGRPSQRCRTLHERDGTYPAAPGRWEDEALFQFGAMQRSSVRLRASTIFSQDPPLQTASISSEISYAQWTYLKGRVTHPWLPQRREQKCRKHLRPIYTRTSLPPATSACHTRLML